MIGGLLMKREPAYLAMVYHDDPANAATDRKALEWCYSLTEATRLARTAMLDPYWNGQTATVHYGYVVKGDGPVPYWEDDDREQPWLVTADSVERD
jgi:hypothetical protein